MIIPSLFILISLQLSLIETCIKTIPPEEVYITSTPDNLPITEEPVITDKPITDAPVTNAPVTDAPVTDAPVTNDPVTEAPVTDTPVDPELCKNCNPEDIQPDPVTGVSFSIKQIDAPGECAGQITCERTDGLACATVGISAITPNEPFPIRVTDTSTSTSATSTIKCSKDGTYSHLTT
ncbi:unnamed protein product [Caenorhabditis nigoni]